MIHHKFSHKMLMFATGKPGEFLAPAKNSPFSILHSPFSILHSPFSILHSPISNIQYPISNIQYPISNIQYPISASRKRSADDYLKALSRRFFRFLNSRFLISAKNQLFFKIFYAGVSPPDSFLLSKNTSNR